mmetsp:Transcript_3885/g.8555  ORF Transcript_3885/g.8555 Transcript_3885/m.8555 type:complete len:296 (-) Transcript_3885:200-1087(-)
MEDSKNAMSISAASCRNFRIRSADSSICRDTFMGLAAGFRSSTYSPPMMSSYPPNPIGFKLFTTDEEAWSDSSRHRSNSNCGISSRDSSSPSDSSLSLSLPLSLSLSLALIFRPAAAYAAHAPPPRLDREFPDDGAFLLKSFNPIKSSGGDFKLPGLLIPLVKFCFPACASGFDCGSDFAFSPFPRGLGAAAAAAGALPGNTFTGTALTAGSISSALAIATGPLVPPGRSKSIASACSTTLEHFTHWPRSTTPGMFRGVILLGLAGLFAPVAPATFFFLNILGPILDMTPPPDIL